MRLFVKKMGLLVLLISLVFQFARSNEKINKLISSLDTDISDSLKIATCFEIADYYRITDVDSCLLFLDRCNTICEESDLSIRPNVYFNIAGVYQQCQYYEKANSFYRLSSIKAEEKNEKEIRVISENMVGYTYSLMGDSELAIDALFKNLRYIEQNNLKKLYPQTYMMIGYAFRDFGDKNQAKIYFLKANEASDDLYDTIYKHTILNELGNLYTLSDSLELGMEYLLKSLEIRKKMSDPTLLAYSFNDIANNYLYQNKVKEAINYYNKSLTINLKQNNLWGACHSYINLSDAYHGLKQYKNERKMLDSAFVLANKLNLKSIFELIYFQNVRYYENIKDFEKVYTNHKLYIAYRDSIKNESITKQITLINAKYNSEKKDIELAKKQSENIKLKLALILFIIGICSLVIITILLYRMNQVKRSVNKILEDKNKEIVEINAQLVHHANEISTQKDEIKLQRDKYLKLNATKDKFFSIIAHDLKNPFNSLIGFSELLLEDHKSIPEDKLNVIYSTLNKTAKATFTMLENLLWWANSQTGSMKVNPVKLDLNTICQEVIQLYSPFANTKKIRLQSDIEENTTIYSDYNMLHTILRNLVNNALKFTDNEGEVKIESKKSNELVTIFVRDTGVGISPSDISKLFKIEEDMRSIGSKQGKGSGLGLILCKEFAEILGGKIGCESTLGEGSIFYFSIPLNHNK